MLGGSFNPPHVDYLRLAIEAREALGDLVQGVDMTPRRAAAQGAERYAALELRASMVEACAESLPWLRCVSRPRLCGRGPVHMGYPRSAYREAQPQTELYLVLGKSDFCPAVYLAQGLELPQLCHFVVVPGAGHTAGDFTAAAKALWPTAQQRPPVLPGASVWPCRVAGWRIF